MDAFRLGLLWSRTMKLKPRKCFSFGFRQFLKNRKSSKSSKYSKYTPLKNTTYSPYDPLIEVGAKDGKGVPATFIGDQGNVEKSIFKHLGRRFQIDLKDDKIIHDVFRKLKAWMKIVHEAKLEGAHKVWITNELVVSKLLWDMMIQHFPACTVSVWQRFLKKFYKKWTGLAKSAEMSIFFRSRENFGFGLKDIVDCNEQQQVIKWMILKEAKDPNARELYAVRLKWDKEGKIGRGRKSSPCLTVEKILSAVRHR